MIRRIVIYLSILAFCILFWAIIIYGGARWSHERGVALATISKEAQGVMIKL